VPDAVLVWECISCGRRYYTEIPPKTCDAFGGCGGSAYKPVRVRVETEQ